jgi:hypothetical protein
MKLIAILPIVLEIIIVARANVYLYKNATKFLSFIYKIHDKMMW